MAAPSNGTLSHIITFWPWAEEGILLASQGAFRSLHPFSLQNSSFKAHALKLQHSQPLPVEPLQTPHSLKSAAPGSPTHYDTAIICGDSKGHSRPSSILAPSLGLPCLTAVARLSQDVVLIHNCSPLQTPLQVSHSPFPTSYPSRSLCHPPTSLNPSTPLGSTVTNPPSFSLSPDPSCPRFSL